MPKIFLRALYCFHFSSFAHYESPIIDKFVISFYCCRCSDCTVNLAPNDAACESLSFFSLYQRLFASSLS